MATTKSTIGKDKDKAQPDPSALRVQSQPDDNQSENLAEQPKPKTPLANFRRQNPRIDYYPTPQAAAAIERLRKCNPGVCTRELIDALVMKGHNVFFPQTAVQTLPNGVKNGVKKC